MGLRTGTAPFPNPYPASPTTWALPRMHRAPAKPRETRVGLAARPGGELGSRWLNLPGPCQPQPVPGAETKALVSSCQQPAPPGGRPPY